MQKSKVKNQNDHERIVLQFNRVGRSKFKIFREAGSQNFAFCPATVRERSEWVQLRGSRYIPDKNSMWPGHSADSTGSRILTSLRSGYIRDFLNFTLEHQRL